MIFKDRQDAGRRLATALSKFKDKSDLLVLGLPRGGVPVAYEVARYLDAPLDVFIVRKLGFPGQQELAVGAIDSFGGVFLNQEIVQHVSSEALEFEIAKQKNKIEERLKLYCRAPISLKDKTVILVDDGLATGASMMVAVKSLKRLGAKKIVVAVPVAPISAVDKFKREIEDFIVLETPEDFAGVGQWYYEFNQVEDEEVIRLLNDSHEETLMRTSQGGGRLG